MISRSILKPWRFEADTTQRQINTNRETEKQIKKQTYKLTGKIDRKTDTENIHRETDARKRTRENGHEKTK